MTSSKRKQSTITLHDFFGSGAGSSRKRKGKSIPQRDQPPKKTLSKASSENVIVIDSDSDSEPKFVGILRKKSQKIDDSSGGVEFVDDVKCQILRSPHITQHQSLTKNSSASLDLLHFDKSSDPLSSTPALTNTAVVKENPVLLAGTNSVASLNSSLFGAPRLLLRPKDLSVTKHTQESSGNIQLDSNFPTDVLGEDWGMGDDEAASVFAQEEGEEEDGENLTDPLRDSTWENFEPRQKCPSCNTWLDGYSEREICIHVNNCLDSVALPAISIPQIAGNAFSVLMSSHKENATCEETSISENRNFRPTKGGGGRRKAPFYKVLQGMPIAVDAFRYGAIPGITAYFLTHAHSDHYTNLASNWENGPIYCSECTANLIIHMLSVDRKWVHPLPMNIPTVIPNTGGVRVTLIEANHCPGSCLFYFEGPQTVDAGDSTFKSPSVGSSRIFRYLHCGDFRASPQHVLHPAIKGEKIDHVYLDTTYLDPKYMFPPQPLVISACAELARRFASGQSIENVASVDAWMKPRTVNARQTPGKTGRVLVVVGTYSIGKERIVKAIAHALQTKIYCDIRKAGILRCQADPDLNTLLTSNPLEASVHLVPLGTITLDKLKIYVEKFKGVFGKVIGLRPTGWTYTQSSSNGDMPSISSIISRSHRNFTCANLQPARNSTSSLQVFPVPYSEHSSFFELTCFAMSLNWDKMIATVNVGSAISRSKMANWVARWETEQKKQGKDVVVPYRNLDYW